ncbi:hypothetical protein [Paraburkholderia adhaesiva]|uniref:hypothetical protein n=1 Tax=Paraburkholderia adhaesiva TaxID=2883244 RepID=UPI001F21FC2C|nr:hypothetical protein [Paraburkholderia adhaesiva]
MLKPTFFTNELLSGLPPLARLLFAGLWTVADREGRLEDRPARIRAEIFPYEPDTDVDALLDQLHDAGFIARYAINGERYVEVIKWTKHQRPHPHEAASEIPRCPPEAIRKQCRDIGEPSNTTNDMQGQKKSACLPVSKSLRKSVSKSESKHLRLALSLEPGVEPREKCDSRGARLPEGWTLPDEWAAWAMNRCGFSSSQARKVAERFANYWHGLPGAKARKCDWFATWRNWCLGDLGRETHGPPYAPSARDLREARNREVVTVLTGRDPWGPPPEVFDLAPEDVRHVPDRRH